MHNKFSQVYMTPRWRENMSGFSKLYAPIMMLASLAMGHAQTLTVQSGTATTSVDLGPNGVDDKIDSNELESPSSVVANDGAGLFHVHIKDNSFLLDGAYKVRVGLANVGGNIAAGSKAFSMKKPCDGNGTIIAAESRVYETVDPSSGTPYLECDLGAHEAANGLLFDDKFEIRFDRECDATECHLGDLQADVTIAFLKNGVDVYNNDKIGPTRTIVVRETYTATGEVAGDQWQDDLSSLTSSNPTTGAGSDVSITSSLSMTHKTLRTPDASYINGTYATPALSVATVDMQLMSLSIPEPYASSFATVGKTQDLTDTGIAGVLDTTAFDPAGCGATGDCRVVYKWERGSAVSYDLGIARPQLAYFTDDGGCTGDCRGSLKATYTSPAVGGSSHEESTVGFTFSTADADLKFTIVSAASAAKKDPADPALPEDMVTTYPTNLAALYTITTSSASFDLTESLSFTAPTTSDATLSSVGGCADATHAVSGFATDAEAQAWLQSQIDSCTLSEPAKLVTRDQGVTASFAGTASSRFYRVVDRDSSGSSDYARKYTDGSAGADAILTEGLEPDEDATINWLKRNPTCGAVTVTGGDHHPTLSKTATCEPGTVFSLALSDLDLSAQATGCDGSAQAAFCKVGDHSPAAGVQCFDASLSAEVVVTPNATIDDRRIEAVSLATTTVSASISQSTTLDSDPLDIDDATITGTATGAVDHNGAQTDASFAVSVQLARAGILDETADVTVSAAQVAVPYNCEGAAHDVTFTGSFDEPCGDSIPISFVRSYRSAFDEADLVLTATTSGNWEVAEKTLYDDSTGTGTGIPLEIVVSGTAANYFATTAPFSTEARVYFRQASGDAWSECVVDSGSHKCSFNYKNAGRANIPAGAQAENQAVPFELGLKYVEVGDCGAGAAATPATIQKITAAGTTTSLDLLVTPSPEPYRGRIQVFVGSDLVENRPEETAAASPFPAKEVDMDVDRNVCADAGSTGECASDSGVVSDWVPDELRFRFYNPENTQKFYKVEPTGATSSHSVVTINSGSLANVVLSITEAEQCTAAGDDAYPSLAVKLTPCTDVACGPTDLLTDQERTFSLKVRCVSQPANLYLIDDTVAEQSLACESEVNGAIVVNSGCKEIRTLSSNVLGDEWIQRTSLSGIRLRFQQVGTGKTSNQITVASAGHADQSVAILADNAHVDVATDSNCLGNKLFSISTDAGGSLDSYSGSIQIRCVRQSASVSDALTLDYDVEDMQLHLSDDQVLSLAPIPAGFSLSSEAHLGTACGVAALSTDCELTAADTTTGHGLKASVATKDANAFLDYLEDCGATSDDTSDLVREIQVVRTFSRTKDGVSLDYCETRKLSYTVIKSGSATVTVGIAAPQSREFQVQIAKFEYQSCNGGAGLKLHMELDFQMEQSTGAGFQQFAITQAQTGYSECLDSSQASCHEKAAYSVAVGDAFSGGSMTVGSGTSLGNLVIEGQCHATTATCGASTADPAPAFMNDAQSTSFALVHTTGGQQYAALVSIDTEIDCPEDSVAILDGHSASLVVQCDTSGGSTYSACTDENAIPAESSIQLNFTDNSDWDGTIVIDSNTMGSGGQIFDLRDFANNGLIEANYLVNGDLSVLHENNKVLRIMALPEQGKTINFTFGYSRVNGNRRLRSTQTFVLSSDGSATTSVAILPATMEVTDQAEIKQLNDTDAYKNDEELKKTIEANNTAFIGVAITLGVLIIGLIIAVIVLWQKKMKGVASKSGSGTEGTFTEKTPLFSRFVHA